MSLREINNLTIKDWANNDYWFADSVLFTDLRTNISDRDIFGEIIKPAIDLLIPNLDGACLLLLPPNQLKIYPVFISEHNATVRFRVRQSGDLATRQLLASIIHGRDFNIMVE